MTSKKLSISYLILEKCYYKIINLRRFLKDKIIKTRLKYCGIDIRLGFYTVVQSPQYLSIGDYTQIADFTILLAGNNITIGSNCFISTSCMITSVTHKIASYNRVEHNELNRKGLDVSIGNNVWIGANVVILPGTVIGDNSIIAAGSVVKGLVNSDEIWGGAPAIYISTIDFCK